jgi:hypothetical protein
MQKSKPDLAWRVRNKLWFIRAFAKLQKATIGFFMSVRLFVRMQQPRYRWKDFQEILYYSKIC